MGDTRIVRAVVRKLLLSRLARKVLPFAPHYRLLHQVMRGWRRSAIESDGRASDLQCIAVQDGVELWVCWSDVPKVGHGPSASLLVLREEVLRIGCFGGREGHMHLDPEQHWFEGRISAR